MKFQATPYEMIDRGIWGKYCELVGRKSLPVSAEELDVYIEIGDNIFDQLFGVLDDLQ